MEQGIYYDCNPAGSHSCKFKLKSYIFRRFYMIDIPHTFNSKTIFLNPKDYHLLLYQKPFDKIEFDKRLSTFVNVLE